jgi:hypothetical protein
MQSWVPRPPTDRLRERIFGAPESKRSATHSFAWAGWLASGLSAACVMVVTVLQTGLPSTRAVAGDATNAPMLAVLDSVARLSPMNHVAGRTLPSTNVLLLYSTNGSFSGRN